MTVALRTKKNMTIWEPHPGSQEAYMACPAREALIEGNRGGGKTDVLLMDFLQHVGQGYGAAWRGVLFREEYTQLTDVINKSLKWIRQIFPDAKWNGSEHKWTFGTGEVLYLRYMRVPADYWNYHGHEYPWIGWEELTNWATDECYLSMMSCNRCSESGVPLKVRASCNPSGIGHAWVKARFIDSMRPYQIITDPVTGKTRARIQSRLDENKTLLAADPDYLNTIIAATAGSEVKFKAWVKGSWDIIVGGFFYDVWDPKIHVLPHFKMPSSWYVLRSFDWGSQKPWSVSYIAECNGEQPEEEERVKHNLPYFSKGTTVVFDEIYGWDGATPDAGDGATSKEIAERVKEKDKKIQEFHGIKVHSGPADTQIYEVRDGTSIAARMARERVVWKKAYKGSGSRVAGWDIMRTRLKSALDKKMEAEHLYFTIKARHHIRTLPLMQTDEKKMEDIDSKLEDHAMDSCRYGLTRKLIAMTRKKVCM